jgi:hypothetical protein
MLAIEAYTAEFFCTPTLSLPATSHVSTEQSCPVETLHSVSESVTYGILKPLCRSGLQDPTRVPRRLP